MSEVKLIKIREEILADNRGLADELRSRMKRRGVTLLNIMASPGGGKTSLILKTIDALRETTHIGVIEADLDSTVDADKVAAVGVDAVQIETGGFCHIDAAMVERALESLDPENLDLILIENVGNLVCPADVDTGADANVVILSIPEGDDKPLKYPNMFAVADVVVVNKIDYLKIAPFDFEAFSKRVHQLKPGVPIIEVSCVSGAGIPAWADWLRSFLGR